jgi:hypothetical protein
MTLMTLEEARRVLKEEPKAGAENYVRHATASAVIYMNDAVKRGYSYMTVDRAETSQQAVARIAAEWRRNRPQTRTADGSGPSGMRDVPGRTNDQPVRYAPFERPKEFAREEARGTDLRSSWANIQGPTKSAGLKVGGRLVQTLPGDLSAYYLAVDPATNKTGLYYLDPVEQDPGMVGRSDGTTARTMDRSPAYYDTLRRQAATQRELSGIKLRSINEQNRNYWQGQKTDA